VTGAPELRRVVTAALTASSRLMSRDFGHRCWKAVERRLRGELKRVEKRGRCQRHSTPVNMVPNVAGARPKILLTSVGVSVTFKQRLVSTLSGLSWGEKWFGATARNV